MTSSCPDLVRIMLQSAAREVSAFCVMRHVRSSIVFRTFHGLLLSHWVTVVSLSFLRQGLVCTLDWAFHVLCCAAAAS